MDNRKTNWLKYKSEFLKANHCTVKQFEAAYIKFIKSNPNTADYRQFALKWGITIIHDPNIPERGQALFSVNISAMKIMAKTFEESEDAIRSIVGSVEQ